VLLKLAALVDPTDILSHAVVSSIQWTRPVRLRAGFSLPIGKMSDEAATQGRPSARARKRLSRPLKPVSFPRVRRAAKASERLKLYFS
jgi:hypothetical protein